VPTTFVDVQFYDHATLHGIDETGFLTALAWLTSRAAASEALQESHKTTLQRVESIRQSPHRLNAPSVSAPSITYDRADNVRDDTDVDLTSDDGAGDAVARGSDVDSKASVHFTMMEPPTNITAITNETTVIDTDTDASTKVKTDTIGKTNTNTNTNTNAAGGDESASSRTNPSIEIAVEEDEADEAGVLFVEVDLEGGGPPLGDAEEGAPRPSMLGERTSTGGSFVSSIASTGRSLGQKLGQWFGVVPPEDETAIGAAIDLGSRFGRSASRKSTCSVHSVHSVQPPPEVGFEVHNLFDPQTPATATLPTSLYGEVLDADGDTPLITDYHAALMAYRRFIAKAKVLKRKRMQRNLTDESNSTNVHSMVSGARSTRGGPHRKGALAEDIKIQLRSLPTFTPRFIPAITFVQLAIICAMLFDSYSRKEFARIGLAAVKSKCSTDPGGIPTCPLNFKGLLDTEAVQTESANIWIGPEARYLVRFGGRFAPCMRKDLEIRSKTTRVRIVECGTTVEECDDPTISGGLGFSCCGYEARSYGMLNNATCQESGGVWLEERGRHRQCNEFTEAVHLRPCCVGNTGQCELYTESQCEFYEGLYHPDKQLCSEVACLAETCTTVIDSNNGPTASEENHNELPNPNQWWRFIWPLFMHAGVIHYVLCMLIQWVVGCQIERTAGWLRVLLIYFTSGIGGYVVSGLFDPTAVTCGSDPAVFGLLAVLYVELFQSWRVVPKPWTELAKLITIFGVATVVGTLPFIDNFGHFGGFIFGILASIIFLPYITFGKWDYRRKRVLLYISGPILLSLFFGLLLTFYLVQDAGCPWCKSMNCLAYTDDIECN
jgi:membrane associated rhomboid family serine protease